MAHTGGMANSGPAGLCDVILRWRSHILQSDQVLNEAFSRPLCKLSACGRTLDRRAIACIRSSDPVGTKVWLEHLHV